MTNGRDKGKRGERECARLLEAWWRRLETECEFVTTPASGGWASAGLRGEFRASGDLMTTARQFPFAVEVKWREAWSLKRLTLGQASPIWGWWRQAQRAAVEMQAEPLLLFRRNRFPWMAMLTEVAAEMALIRAGGRRAKGTVRVADRVVGEGVAVEWAPRCWLDVVAEWDPIELASVDYGGAVPVLASASSLLATDPEAWVSTVG